MEDSREAIWQQLQAYIKNISIRLQLFYLTLRNCKEKTDIISLRSDDGFTLLHEVIRNKREDLMPSLLYCGVLLPLYDEPVGQDGGEYTGLTPVDLAARFGAEKERLAMELNIRLARNIQRHPLKKACLDGNVQEFQAIIQQEPYGVGSYTDGKTCLHLAIISGSIPLVNAVLEAEANISFVRTEGDAKEVLVQAITLGHSNMIEPLLEHSHVDIDSIEIDGKRLMEKIVEYEDIESFNILQRRGVAIPETLLAIAASCGSEEFAKMLIENHCPPLEINFRDRRQKTALHFATESGHLRVIELLITNGADMKAKDKRGRSFLHSAAEQGNIEVLELVVRILETGGALQELLNSPDKHLGPELCFLVRGRDLEQPAWHYVHVDRGVLDIFRMKTRGGAVDVAQYGRVIKSGWGSNPAQEEVQEVESQFDMVNISPTAPPDMLPLHLAILKNNRDVALHLIELMTEAAINTEDCFGLTPLHYACMRGMVQIVSALVDKRANCSAIDRKGRNIELIASINDHPHVVEYLRSGSVLESIAAFVQAHVEPLLEKFSHAELQRRMNNGENIQLYIRTVLRETTGDINSFLFDVLKTGPVAEETEPNGVNPPALFHAPTCI